MVTLGATLPGYPGPVAATGASMRLSQTYCATNSSACCVGGVCATWAGSHLMSTSCVMYGVFETEARIEFDSSIGAEASFSFFIYGSSDPQTYDPAWNEVDQQLSYSGSSLQLESATTMSVARNSPANASVTRKTEATTAAPADGGYHNYKLVWTPQYLVFMVDNATVRNTTNSPWRPITMRLVFATATAGNLTFDPSKPLVDGYVYIRRMKYTPLASDPTVAAAQVAAAVTQANSWGAGSSAAAAAPPPQPPPPPAATVTLTVRLTIAGASLTSTQTATLKASLAAQMGNGVSADDVQIEVTVMVSSAMSLAGVSSAMWAATLAAQTALLDSLAASLGVPSSSIKLDGASDANGTPPTSARRRELLDLSARVPFAINTSAAGNVSALKDTLTQAASSSASSSSSAAAALLSTVATALQTQGGLASATLAMDPPTTASLVTVTVRMAAGPTSGHDDAAAAQLAGAMSSPASAAAMSIHPSAITVLAISSARVVQSATRPRWECRTQQQQCHRCWSLQRRRMLLPLMRRRLLLAHSCWRQWQRRRQRLGWRRRRRRRRCLMSPPPPALPPAALDPPASSMTTIPSGGECTTRPPC